MRSHRSNVISCFLQYTFLKRSLPFLCTSQYFCISIGVTYSLVHGLISILIFLSTFHRRHKWQLMPSNISRVQAIKLCVFFVHQTKASIRCAQQVMICVCNASTIYKLIFVYLFFVSFYLFFLLFFMQFNIPDTTESERTTH